MNPELVALAAIMAALFVGIISPGPSFVLVARTSLALDRTHGLAVSLGMGLGGAFFAAAALSGLQLVFNALPVLFVLLKLLGGAYLVWLGLRIWRSSTESLVVDPAGVVVERSFATSLFLGLTTQLSNPKTSIVYASVFAAFLPVDYGMEYALLIVICAFILEASWYSIVSVVLSLPVPRSVYLDFKMSLDRLAGGVVMLLGARLMLSSRV